MEAYGSFIEVASQYCSLIERHADLSIDDFLNQTHEILPVLYHRALLLGGSAEIESPMDLAIPHNTWQSIYNGLGALLEDKSLYWSVFDPIAQPPEQPVARSLADDLADIWRDLAIGVTLWPAASELERQSIVWQWRFSFQTHWSHHLVDALCAINQHLVFNRFSESENA